MYVSSGADGGQFHHENVMSTAFIFLLGALRGTSEVDRGKSYILCIYFSLVAMCKLGDSRGLLGFSGSSRGHIGGSFIGKKLCPRHLFYFE